MVIWKYCFWYIVISVYFKYVHDQIKIKIPNNSIGLHEYLFSEDQSRYLVEINTKNRDIVTKILEENSIYYEVIGKTQKNNLDLDGEFNISLEELNKLNSYWFKNFFKESC